MLCTKNILLNLTTFSKVAQSFWLHLSQRWKKVEKGGN